MTIPVWLLDVDGVINAERPLWDSPVETATARSLNQDWTMRWAVALVDRIRKLALARRCEVHWCSTWCADADQLERIWQFPKLERSFSTIHTGPYGTTLKEAAVAEVAARGRRLIWTDDVVTPDSGQFYRELTADGRALLIRPETAHGLTPCDMKTIEAFCEL